MAIKQVEERAAANGFFYYIVKGFIVDADEDFENLPKCDPSSVALNPHNGKVYVVDASGNWGEFGAGG